MKEYRFGDRVKVFNRKHGIIASSCPNPYWYNVLICSDENYEINNSHRIEKIHIDNISKVLCQLKGGKNDYI